MKTVKYPVKFRIKIILENKNSTERDKSTIISIFEGLNIDFVNLTANKSKKANYISYSATITVNSKEILYKLYDKIKQIENFKFAI